MDTLHLDTLHMDTVIWTETPQRTAWWESILGLDSDTAATAAPAPDALGDAPAARTYAARPPRTRGLDAA